MLTVYTRPRAFSTAGDNLDEYLAAAAGNGAFIPTRGANQVDLLIRRYGDVGTCTLQAFLEFLFEPEQAFYPIFDFAGAAVAGVSYADGATDSAGSYHKLTLLRDGPPPITHTAGVATYNTIHKVYQCDIPEKIRVRFRHGGTAVQNDFAAQLHVHWT